MCKLRDIILIDNYVSEGTPLNRHSFVVIDEVGDEIQGVPYDFVCNVMSSFKNETQKARKLSYPGNFPITASDAPVSGGNGKDGYIKADQFYYFNKSKIDYTVIGSVNIDVFDELLNFIENGDFEIASITDNL